MFRKSLSYLILPVLLLFGASSGDSASQKQAASSPDVNTGTLEKLIVAGGSVTLNLDLNLLNGAAAVRKDAPQLEAVRFDVAPNSFFPILVFNSDLRGPALGSMALLPAATPRLPDSLRASFGQLVLEKVAWDQAYDLVIRDAKTGFVFFNIEGDRYEYDATSRALRVIDGRVLLSDAFARNLGRPADVGAVVGNVSVSATMSTIETQQVVNGEVESATLPPVPENGSPGSPEAFNNGPDVIVGDLPALQQFGSVGSQVGLAVGTTSCNAGNVELNWFALPAVDHPVIPMNLYRMSGGSSSTDRFEQVGQSWLKHAFTALQNNACSFGCTAAANGTHLGVGCSDPYSVSLNATQSGLGSRAWVNPFTGAYPATSRDHTGHTHSTISHLILVNASDLNTTQNVGSTYYAEAQYVTPHEYAWCQSHPGQCNMYNNASYRRFSVAGTTSFTFTAVGSTVRMSPAIAAWTGATTTMFEPEPGVDGRGFIAYKVTGPVAGVYHYEYAVYNQNLDRGIGSFSIPLGCGVTISNLGFHAPLNAPAFANDGTAGSAGFSNADWTASQTANAVTWNTQTLAQNANANAIRWATMYNFRFDSTRPPQNANATVGFFKNGSPILVAVQGPTPDSCSPLQVTDAVSRKVQGPAGTFDIHLPGVESRSGGASGNHTLVFTFTNNVTSGHVKLDAAAGAVDGNPTFSNNTMTVNLTGMSDVQMVGITLQSVTDSIGQVLPDTSFNMGVLMGDTSGDGIVNGGDTIQARLHAGETLGAANCRMDVTADGFINGGDAVVVRSHSGNSIAFP